MKQWIISVIVVFAAAFGGITAMAEDFGVELSVGSAYVKSGETFSVPVYAEVNEGFASFTIDIEYDSTVLLPVSITRGSNLTGLLIPNLTYGENTIRTVYAGMMDCTQSGDLFYVEFTAVTETDGTSELKPVVSFLSNEQYNDVSHTETGGRVNVWLNGHMPFAVELDGISGQAVVSNISDAAADGVLYMVSFDDKGRMMEVRSEPVRINAAEYGQYALNAPEAGLIKGFVWEESMQPQSYTAKIAN